MVSRRKRKHLLTAQREQWLKERDKPQPPAGEPAPPPPAAWTWWVAGAIVLAGVVLAVLVWFVWAQNVRDATLSATCGFTGCNPGATAVVGFLFALTPFAYASLGRGRWEQALGPDRIAWAVGGVVSLLIAAMFLGNGDGESFPGPGGAGFTHGALWGVMAYLGTLVVVGLTAIIGLKINREISTRTLVVLGTVAIGICGITVAATAPKNELLMTTQILPETTIRAQGDVLTRVSATDLDGCGGRFDGCRRTAEFEFTTDDSDAVVKLEIVSFADNDRAWDAWGAVRPPRDPAVLQEVNVTGEWLLLSTVRHGDGRAIAADEEKWLRWPAKQLEWAFRDAIGYSLTYAPEPSATAAPRTP